MNNDHKIRGEIGFSKTLVFVCLLLLILISGLFAQENRVLKVIVHDQNGDIVLKYKARLRNTKTQLLRAQKSRKNGILEFSGLRQDEYSLEILAKGFKRFSKDIRLAEMHQIIDVVLEIEEINEVLEVGLSPGEKRF